MSQFSETLDTTSCTGERTTDMGDTEWEGSTWPDRIRRGIGKIHYWKVQDQRK